MSEAAFHRPVSRRELLRAGAVAGGGLAAGAYALRAGNAPAFVRSGNRPVLTHGIQSGDATARRAVVWARGDRPSRMLVEVSRTPSFQRSYVVRGPILTPESDLTGKVLLRGLHPARDVFYRVELADLDDASLTSEPLEGSFRTAPVTRGDDVSLVWGGDIAGQGWGINPEFGGYRIFDAMADLEPDFFLCSGDTVYADGPIVASVPLTGGRTWKNVTTPEKAEVAESLDEFRGQYAYNLLDEPLRRFAARVPQVNQWDDHEVRNNWYPGQVITDDRYTEKSADVLAERARRAFFEWLPIRERGPEGGRIYRRIPYGPLLDLFVLDMRTYKDPNSDNRYADPALGLLGAEQRAWLKRGLAASTATWKILAIDLPLGLVVPDGPVNQEGVAQGDAGAPLGRELEFADVLRTAASDGVTGIVFLTADVHYTAAHFYDPGKAAIADFDPFWEFVSGPLNAGAFGPNALDKTFGPEAVYVAAPPAPNTSPADGYQFFGRLAIDAQSKVMAVELRDTDGTVLYSVDLEPEAKARRP